MINPVSHISFEEEEKSMPDVFTKEKALARVGFTGGDKNTQVNNIENYFNLNNLSNKNSNGLISYIPEPDEEAEENKELPLNEDQAMDHRPAKIVVTDQAAERISKESGLFGLNSAVNNDLFKKFNYQRRQDHKPKPDITIPNLYALSPALKHRNGNADQNMSIEDSLANIKKTTSMPIDLIPSNHPTSNHKDRLSEINRSKSETHGESLDSFGNNMMVCENKNGIIGGNPFLSTIESSDFKNNSCAGLLDLKNSNSPQGGPMSFDAYQFSNGKKVAKRSGGLGGGMSNNMRELMDNFHKNMKKDLLKPAIENFRKGLRENRK